MPPRNIIFIISAVIILLGVGLGVYAHIQSLPPDQPVVEAPPPGPKILVAKADITIGSFVQVARDLDWRQLAHDEPVPTGAMLEEKEKIADYEGAVARKAIKNGDMITSENIVRRSAGGFLAAVLNPGMRAVSVAVTATSGASGLIFPGDRVDMLAVFNATVDGGGIMRNVTYTQTVLENIRVVAVNQQIDNPTNQAITATTITIEATPQQLEKIAVAQERGKLTAVLRSLNDQSKNEKTVETPSGEQADETKKSEVVEDPEYVSKVPDVRVIRGSASSLVQFSPHPEQQ